MAHVSRIAALLVITLAAPAAASFNVVQCLAEHTKAECTREMMIEQGMSKPLDPRSEVRGDSGAYSITIEGENWLKMGWGGNAEKAKDLGVEKDTGVGLLTIEKTEVRPAEFETVLTEEMKALYNGLEDGFKKGKIAIKATTQMEIMSMSIPGGGGKLGRFCYHIDLKEGKDVCVYEGFTNSDDGQYFKLIGSIGDYDNMRAQLESIITSFKFTSPETTGSSVNQ